MEAVAKKWRCVYCSSDSLFPVLKVDKVPTSSQVLYKKQSDALGCETKSLDILMCGKCGLIFNRDYFSDKTMSRQYSSLDYYCSVSFSPQAGEYQKKQASEINRWWGLKGKNVCEIGCGDGFFLNEISQYCSRAVGFEPSPTFSLARKYPDLVLCNDYFDPKDSKVPEDIKINLFILRHVLEHLTDPFRYLKSLRECYQVKEKEQGLFLEVPDAAYLMANNLYFDFYYDHIYYFTPFFLRDFLMEMGWKKIRLLEKGHKEFIRALCYDSSRQASPKKDEPGVSSSLRQAAGCFSADYSKWKSQIQKVLDDIKGRNKKIGAWGAGSRGITMLIAMTGEKGLFSYVIDSDINKQERFIPMLGIPIMPSGVLKKRPVEYLLVTSYTYFDEIVEELGNYRQQGLKIIKPYPEVEII